MSTIDEKEKHSNISHLGLFGAFFSKWLFCNLETQKHFSLSPRLFSKATEMISGDFNSVSSVNNLEILSLCL